MGIPIKKIADLFVELGIKGDGPANKALGQVKTALANVASGALVAVAGVGAAVAAFKLLTNASNETGNQLSQFEKLTGISADTLQRYRYAAQQFGVANGEVDSSLKSVQKVMTDIYLNRAPPEAIGLLSQLTGGLDLSKMNPNKEGDILDFFNRLQKGAQRVGPGVSQDILGQFGVSSGVIQAMNQNAFNLDALKNAPVYSEKQVQALQRESVAWSNLGTKISMAIGSLNSKHGMELIKGISEVTTSLLHLVDALLKLSERWNIFGKISTVMQGAANIIDPKNIDKNKKALAYAGERASNFVHEGLKSASNAGADLEDFFLSGRFVESMATAFAQAIVPSNPTGAIGGTSNNVNNNNIVTNIHTDAKHPQAHADHVNRQIKSALYTSPAYLQGP